MDTPGTVGTVPGRWTAGGEGEVLGVVGPDAWVEVAGTPAGPVVGAAFEAPWGVWLV